MTGLINKDNLEDAICEQMQWKLISNDTVLPKFVKIGRFSESKLPDSNQDEIKTIYAH